MMQSGDKIEPLKSLMANPIAAGGHHEAGGPSPCLAQGADFHSRAEFMRNTQGWLASDEMQAMTKFAMEPS